METLRIKKVHPKATIPEYKTKGAAGFDLAAVEDVVIHPGETVLVDTGLVFEIPRGWEIQIRPRSGMSLKSSLRVANAPGTIDSDFRGSVKIILSNIDGKETHYIRAGERIAQGVLAKSHQANIVEVEEVTETERGEGGFGSTDKEQV